MVRPRAPAIEAIKARPPGAEVALAALLAAFLGLAGLHFPFGRDQGEYATIAQIARDGGAVYRDVFHTKPPMTHLVYELALASFGRTMMSIRLLDLLWQSGTAAAIAMLGLRVDGRRGIGALAGVLYATAYYLRGHWATAQTDGFLTLPLALGLLAFLEGERRDRAALHFLCGAAVGVAVLFKYPIGIILPLLTVITLRQPGARIRRAAALWAGFGALLTLSAASLAVQGSLRDFLAIQLQYLPTYTVRGGGEDQGYLTAMGRNLIEYCIVNWTDRRRVDFEVCVAAFAAELLLRRRDGDHAVGARVLASFWIAAALHFVLQNKFYSYHDLPVLAPSALLLARLGLRACDAARDRAPLRALAAAPFAAYVLGSYAHALLPAQRDLLRVALGAQTMAEVYAADRYSSSMTDYSVRADMEVARYLERRTHPTDRVFIWGFEPTVYFLSQRACAARFIYNFPLYPRGDFRGSELREDLVRELEREPPRYILVVRNDPLPRITGTEEDSYASFQRFDGLRGLVEARYQLDASIEDFVLYRRRDETAAPAMLAH